MSKHQSRQSRYSPEAFSSIPLAFILELQHPEPKLPKYILSCQTIAQPLSNKKYKPSHLVLLLRYHNHHEYSFGRVALLELNRMGVELKLQDERDHSGRLIPLHDKNGKVIGLFADEGNVNQTHRVVICDWNEREMIISQSLDLVDGECLKIQLNQKKVEESNVERVEVEVVHQTPNQLYRANNCMDVSVIEQSTHSSNNALPYLAFDRYSKKHCLALFSIEKIPKKENSGYLLRVSEKISTTELNYGFYVAIMKSRQGQKYIFKYSPQSTDYSSIAVGHVNLNTSKKFSYVPITVSGFDMIFQQNTYKIKQILCHTQLSEGKYLFMTLSKAKKISNNFQQYFTNEIIWLLIDINEKRTKRVFPRVYDIASEKYVPSSRKISTLDEAEHAKNEIEFQTVQKKKRGGKIKKFSTEEHMYLDGDLNGGYSDPVLLQKIKKENKSLDSSPSSVMIPILREDKINEDVTMRAIRPFFSNPDIFQVFVFFGKVLEVNAGMDINPHYGKMFSFFFKFRDVTNVKVRKVGRRFSDVDIITSTNKGKSSFVKYTF